MNDEVDLSMQKPVFLRKTWLYKKLLNMHIFNIFVRMLDRISLTLPLKRFILVLLLLSHRNINAFSPHPSPYQVDISYYNQHSSSPLIRSITSFMQSNDQSMIDTFDTPPNPSHFFSKKSFADLKPSKYVSTVLRHLSLDRPSKIQALTYPFVASGKSCIIADQTGSGKTLAYLLPLLDRLYKGMKPSSNLRQSSRDHNTRVILHPNILIIAPTAELASQVARVTRDISSVLRFRSVHLSSSTRSLHDEISSFPRIPYDDTSYSVEAEVLVSTPGRLYSYLKNGDISLNKTSAIVLDEADVLFLDETFPLQGIGQHLPIQSRSNTSSIDCQYLFVTATLPDIIATQIAREFPETITLKGPGLHRIPPTVEENLIDCSILSRPGNTKVASRSGYIEKVNDIKKEKLTRLIADNDDVERTLIFCNTIESCRFVENSLRKIDQIVKPRKVLPYHSALDKSLAQDNLSEFSRKLLHDPVILICTDRASRGIDFESIDVGHVILFDFPQEPSEYVRRAGRTGRAGRFGKVSILAHGKQIPIVKNLLAATRVGKRISPVPSLSTIETYTKRDIPEEKSEEDELDDEDPSVKNIPDKLKHKIISTVLKKKKWLRKYV